MNEKITLSMTDPQIAEYRMPSKSGDFVLTMPLRPNTDDADDFLELLALIQKQIRRRQKQAASEADQPTAETP